MTDLVEWLRAQLDEDAAHIARRDPARARREVAAKRWILQQHAHYRSGSMPAGHPQSVHGPAGIPRH